MTPVPEPRIGEPSRSRQAETDLIGGPPPREARLARALVQLADSLVAEFDVVDLLTRLSDHCIEVLDVDASGIMLASPDGDLAVIASSSEAMRLLELFELQAEEGPCLDCFGTGRAVASRTLAESESAWPRFTAEARDAGFESTCALPMRLRGSVIGALNLFHKAPGAMRPSDLVAGQSLADIATIAILQHRAAEESQVVTAQLNRALNTRVIIEQAKGMIAAHQGSDVDASFRRLRAHARNHNERLSDLASAIVNGRLSPGALDRPRRTP